MSRIKNIEIIVKRVLKEIPETRKDDFLLVAEVYYKIRPEIMRLPFNLVMFRHRDYKLPYFESISRARRKLQAENKELRPSQEVQDARLNKTSEYINYAIDGYKPTFKSFINSLD